MEKVSAAWVRHGASASVIRSFVEKVSGQGRRSGVARALLAIMSRPNWEGAFVSGNALLKVL